MKKCPKCGRRKAEHLFSRNKGKRDGRATRCKSCYKKQWNEYRANNPEKLKQKSLRIRYGVSLEWYKEQLDRQEHKCAICKIELSGAKACLDHNHETGAVRGILCQPCNLGIVRFEEGGLLWVRAAEEYLTEAGDFGTGIL